MPWSIILSPFWMFPFAGWIFIGFDLAPKEQILMLVGASSMVGSPIIAVVLFLSFYSRYREAKIRAKRDARIAKKEEKNEVREPDAVSEV